MSESEFETMYGGKRGGTPYINAQQDIFKLMMSVCKLSKADVFTPVGVAPKWIAKVRERDPNKSHEAYQKLEYVMNYIKTNPQKAKEEFLAFKKANPPKPRGKKGSKKSKK